MQYLRNFSLALLAVIGLVVLAFTVQHNAANEIVSYFAQAVAVTGIIAFAIIALVLSILLNDDRPFSKLDLAVVREHVTNVLEWRSTVGTDQQTLFPATGLSGASRLGGKLQVYDFQQWNRIKRIYGETKAQEIENTENALREYGDISQHPQFKKLQGEVAELEGQVQTLARV